MEHHVKKTLMKNKIKKCWSLTGFEPGPKIFNGHFLNFVAKLPTARHSERYESALNQPLFRPEQP
jgi:hypothetical protein